MVGARRQAVILSEGLFVFNPNPYTIRSLDASDQYQLWSPLNRTLEARILLSSITEISFQLLFHSTVNYQFSYHRPKVFPFFLLLDFQHLAILNILNGFQSNKMQKQSIATNTQIMLLKKRASYCAKTVGINRNSIFQQFCIVIRRRRIRIRRRKAK